ncbi:FGGY family carbohydrate kinase [Haladaptatus sp. DYF46]|uniref:FGGY family carbohydrate kinase n=1 Tax=Haladaptatus sp. DYF46 TaxID=2886041 RepID=UPI001E58ABB7|nr:FGGY family carbohydrate kinase [Haladaptatus sp. DYF46]
MSETHLIGIDMEIQEFRITAYDRSGNKVLGSKAEFDQYSIDDWVRALRDASVFLPKGRNIVTAVGTSGTIVPVDKYGTPVFEPQWYFETAPEQATRLRKLEIANDLPNRRLLLSASSPIPKILALREQNPDRFEEIEWILSPTTWLLYRLHMQNGERWRDIETDWNNALKFGADISTTSPQWYEPVFDTLDLSLDILPEITAPGSWIGHAESQLASEMGLRDAEIYHGLTDGNASALAAGSIQSGDCSIICGTSSVIKYASQEIDADNSLYFHRHPIQGYLASAAFDTGYILRWFCENVLDTSLSSGLKLAQSTNAGDEPRVFIQGDRSPFFNPDVGTTILDFWPEDKESPEETRGRLVRGFATGIALSENTYFDLLENQFDNLNTVHLISGGKSRGQGPFTWWNTLRASIWEQEVIKMEPRTSAGALIPTALEASIYPDVKKASDTLLHSHGPIPADESIHSLYEEERTEFKENWETINHLYKMIRDRRDS